MAFIARDGRRFVSSTQLYKYEQWQDQEAKAPGGPAHRADMKEHGPVTKLTITREGMGRHHIEATHRDGFVHSSVHPDAQRAHDIARELLGIEPPPSQQVHQRARSQPVGPKEEERVAREDHRELEPGEAT